MRAAIVGALAAVAAALASPAGAQGAGLKVGEMQAWRIVCDARATQTEKYAASEFQQLYRGLTGRTLPIVEQAGARGNVLIGPDAVKRAGVRMPAAALGEEGLRVRVDRDTLSIDGGRPRGTLYGVYEFFEDRCGVRFLTFDDTWFPPNARTRTLALGSWAHVPQFAFRWSYYGETARYPDFAARLRNNTTTSSSKLGGISGYRLVMHNVTTLVPPAKYGQDHPEYYALVKGTRLLKVDGGGPQLCLTNPALVDIVTESVLAEARRDPTARNINIAQMDNDSYCTCPRCAALDAREGSHSGTMLTFVNKVAAKVERANPKLLVSTFAYWYTRKPPKTIRARHNVLVQLCSIECCDLHAIDDPTCELNRTFCHDMAVWKQKVDRLLVWHYNTNFSAYMLPFPNLQSIGRSVAYFAANNGRGVFMQAAGNGFSTEFSDLRNYVMSRCLWKPGRDSWQEAMEFCRLHYRESSGPIIAALTEYYDYVKSRGTHPTCFAAEPNLAIDDRSTLRMMKRFDQALALAKSDVVRDRVAKASLCAYRAAISASNMRYAYADGEYRPVPSGFDPDIVDKYRALCARFGVTMESEGSSLETYLSSAAVTTLRTATWKAIAIENPTWRVVVLPDCNAKVVQMIHRPTGRDVVLPHRPFGRFRFEEWMRKGDGPSPQQIMAFTPTEVTPDHLKLTVTTPDGTQMDRTIALRGDTVRFDTTVTAQAARPVDIWVHPEYDAVTPSTDRRIIAAYVKSPKWTHANLHWASYEAKDAEDAAFNRALKGGVFAFYNHSAKYGIEQRFNPREFQQMAFRPWPSRTQVNLELFPRPTALEAGQSMHYGYEVRYLSRPPIAR